MKNKFFIFGCVIILCIIFMYAFSASYSSQNISNIAYVIAIGIDTSETENNYKFTFEFIDISTFSKDSPSENSNPILEEVVAPSISSAIDVMNSYISKQLNLSHCKVIVFSKEVAKKGVLTLTSEIINDKQARPTINVVVANDNSKEYLENSVSSLEKNITKYFDIFTDSTSYTGYSSNITLAQFYENILTKEAGSIAIYGNILPTNNNEQSSNEKENSSQNSNSSNSKPMTSSDNSNSEEKNSSNNSETKSNNSSDNSQNIAKGVTLEASIRGDKGTENSGIAVFKDDVYIDCLSTKESLCYAILSDKINNFFLSIENPFNDEGLLDLSLSANHNVKVDIDTSTENPVININVSLENKILSVFDNVDYNNEENLDLISKTTNEYLENHISEYLYKCSKQYDTDLNYFYKTARKNFSTNSDWYSYDWKNKFKNSTFNVVVKSEIIPTFIVSQSEKY